MEPVRRAPRPVLAPALLTTLVLVVGCTLARSALAEENPPPPPAEGAGAQPPGPPPGARQPYVLRGKYTVSGENKTADALAVTTAETDESAVFVDAHGSLVLTAPTIQTTGHTSSPENSSFFGLNAAVLAADGGRIVVSGGSIVTSGSGANAAFATGTGSSVSLSQLRIEATGAGGHGVMVSAGGGAVLDHVDIVTTKAHAAALATDRGGGSVTATGGKILTQGPGSPAIYSTGNITVTGASLRATGAEGAVIEGSNTITLKDCSLIGERLCGAMIYQSFSGDARGQHGTFRMEGGSFSAMEGPLFYITNTRATILLKDATLEAVSGVLIEAAAGRWGRKDRNNGHATVFADHEKLVGDLVCDQSSSITLTLRQNSSLVGRIATAALTIDGTSVWEVTGNSALTTLLLPSTAVSGKTIDCIVGNGHRVTYDPSLAANRWLGGRTYALTGGGQLAPDDKPLLRK